MWREGRDKGDSVRRLTESGPLSFFFFSSRRRHTILQGDWSSDVCSSDLSCTHHAPTAASRYSNTDRPCWVQLAITVQIRSHQRSPRSLLVPCVISRSITTDRKSVV